MWKRDEAVKPTAPARPGASARRSRRTAASRGAGSATANHASEPTRGHGEDSCEHREVRRHQGRAQRQRGSDHRRAGRRQDRAAPERAHHRRRTAGSRRRSSPSRSSSSARSPATSPPSDKVDIRDNGSVDGDIAAPRVAIAEGAHFRGSIDMQKAAGKPGEPAQKGEPKGGRSRAKPAATPGRADRHGARRRGAIARIRTGCACARRPAVVPGAVRPMLSDLLRWGGKRPASRPTPRPTLRRRAATSRLSPRRPSRSSSTLLAASASRRSCSISGRWSAATSSFFGERLGCKLFIEDLFADSTGTPAPARSTSCRPRSRPVPARRRARVDGILCWDFFDFLDKAGGAGAGAARSSACSGPAAPCMGFFCTASVDRARRYTKYEIVDDTLTCATARTPAIRRRAARRSPTATSSGCSTG